MDKKVKLAMIISVVVVVAIAIGLIIGIIVKNISKDDNEQNVSEKKIENTANTKNKLSKKEMERLDEIIENDVQEFIKICTEEYEISEDNYDELLEKQKELGYEVEMEIEVDRLNGKMDNKAAWTSSDVSVEDPYDYFYTETILKEIKKKGKYVLEEGDVLMITISPEYSEGTTTMSGLVGDESLYQPYEIEPEKNSSEAYAKVSSYLLDWYFDISDTLLIASDDYNEFLNYAQKYEIKDLELEFGIEREDGTVISDDEIMKRLNNSEDVELMDGDTLSIKLSSEALNLSDEMTEIISE